MLRSLISALPLGLEVRKALRPSVAVGRARDRFDWLRLSRAITVTRRKDLVRIGTRYGGYVVPEGLPTANWVCYTAGLGEDVSFELQFVERFGCTIHGFDPTPRAIRYAEQVANGEPRFEVFPFGLWSHDGPQRFYSPRDADHVSHSISNLQGTNTYFDAPCRRISSVMCELGHDRLDLLKLDIEGAEHLVLESLEEDGILPQLLLVDIHPTPSLAHAVSSLRSLEERGYVAVHVFRSDVTLVHASAA
jgi:FkbM family methyltransferase